MFDSQILFAVSCNSSILNNQDIKKLYRKRKHSDSENEPKLAILNQIENKSCS